MTDPVVLDESKSLGIDDHVHAEPALIEASLGPKFAELRERRRRQNRQGKHIEERTDGNRGLHSKLGEQRRSELLRDDRVSMACRVGALYVGVVLVDGEVIRRGLPQRDFSSEVR